MLVRNYKVRQNKGFSLISTLGVIVAMTLGVAVIGIKLTSEISDVDNKTQRSMVTNTSRSINQVAIEHLRNYVFNRFDDLTENFSGSGSIVPTDSQTSESQGNGFLTLNLANVTWQNNSNLYDDLNRLGQNTNESNKSKIGKNVKFISVFFHDKNNNTTLDTGEDTSYLVRSSFVDNKHIYNYVFNITTYAFIGENFASSKVRKKIVTKGSMELKSSPGTFAKYATFLNRSSGAMFWWGDTVRGPFHSNDTIIFAGDPSKGGKSATFYDKVTSSSNNVGWYYTNSSGGWVNGGTTTPLATDLNPKLIQSGTVRVAPDFQKGFQRGVPTIPLPTNSFNQASAAIGGSSTSTTALTAAQEKSFIPVATATVGNGVYVPAENNSGTPVLATNGANTAGGIYIKGDVTSMVMSCPLINPDGIANNGDEYTQQEYLIRQGTGTSANIQRIRIDYNTGKTLVEKLHATTGAVVTSSLLNGTTNGLIHVQGKIDSLSGPPRVPVDSDDPDTAPPAVNKNNAMTISTTGDTIIQGDLKYEIDPRGEDKVFGTGNDDNMSVKNMLGFFSSSGNIRIGTSTKKDFTLHGIVMGSGTSKGFRVDNATSRPQSGKIHLLGGTIEESLSATENSSGTTGFGTDYTYDQRSAKGATPPYFPSTGKLEALDPDITIESTNEETI